MSRHYFFWIVLIALLGLFLTFYSMWQTIKPPPPPQIQQNHSPALAPFKSYISGVGIVEASSSNISIGTPINRIVDQVPVTVGQEVKKGEILFQMENPDLQADLITRRVAYEISLANLRKLEALPRPEDVAAAEATVRSAQVDLNQAKNQYDRIQGLQDSRALSQQEINRRQYAYEQALAKFQQAEASLNKIKAGTWKPDLHIAELKTEQAKAGVERIEAEIQRTIVRSPIDGKILQIKIHQGEFPANIQGPLMIIGDTDEMFLKVSINQFDAPYFRSDAPAVAFLRGSSRIEFPLEFVRLEPYLVSKQNFTNEVTEKIDTRVLQVIYRIKNRTENIFVGQQMDVFIEAEFPS